MPFPHGFASLNWTDKDREQYPAFGEIPGAAHTWVDGSPPPVVFRGRPCGTISEWQNGVAAVPDPPIVPVAWGVPPCCVEGAGQCALLPDRVLSDVSYLFAGSLLPELAYFGSAELLQRWADIVLGPGATIAHAFRPGSVLPSWVAAWNGDQAAIGLAGVESDLELIAAVLAPVPGLQAAGGFKCSLYQIAAAGRAIGEMYAAGLPLDLPLTVAGHSLGGTCADYFAARENQLRPGRRVACLTLGSPRFGDTAMSSILSHAKKTRIEREGDVVPYLPPDFRIYGNFAGLVPAIIANFWAQWVPSGRGLRLTQNGALEDWDPAAAPLGDLIGIVQNFFASLPLGVPHHHSNIEYCRGLQTVAAAADLPPDPRCLDMAALGDLLDDLTGPVIEPALAAEADVRVAAVAEPAAALAVQVTAAEPADIAIGVAADVNSALLVDAVAAAAADVAVAVVGHPAVVAAADVELTLPANAAAAAAAEAGVLEPSNSAVALAIAVQPLAIISGPVGCVAVDCRPIATLVSLHAAAAVAAAAVQPAASMEPGIAGTVQVLGDVAFAAAAVAATPEILFD